MATRGLDGPILSIGSGFLNLNQSRHFPLIGGTTAALVDWRHMNSTNPVPKKPDVEPRPIAVDPIVPGVPVKPVPKPSPEGTSEFWTHVIR
jgi:hypothetical protein